MTLLGTICGCGPERWDELNESGEDKEKWRRTFLDLPAGIPSADTFRRVLSAIEREAFTACFASWMPALVGSTDGKLVAIDGKTARRSFDRAAERPPLHLVSAWVRQNTLSTRGLTHLQEETRFRASAFQRWRVAFQQGIPCCSNTLQWGRRLSAAESLTIECVHRLVREGLQWGRRLSAAESAVGFVLVAQGL